MTDTTALVKQDAILARLDAAGRLLVEARDATDAKRVADIARAVEVYARRQKLSDEAIAYATNIKIDALTLMGEMLKAAEKHRGTAGTGRPRIGGTKKVPPNHQFPPTLADSGISKKESSDAQFLATLRDEEPEAFEEVRAGKTTVKKARAKAKKAKVAAARAAADDEPGRSVQRLEAMVAEGRKFGTIYADPPWRYANQATRASTDNHYGTMALDQIAALPVRDLAAEESHLWLWTTNAFLFDCPRLFEAWGFEFKSSYVWVKPQMGMGNYVRNSHEFLLLGVRGGLVGAAKNVMSWGKFGRTKHSAKPEKIRRQVVEAVSPGPRLELFGRKEVSGWTVWGDQISKQPALCD